MGKDTRFKPGASGNPAGRPPSANSIARLRASIAGEVPEILAKQVELAKAGDAQAARLLLERVLPAVKAVEQAVPVKLLGTASLVEQGRAVLQAAGAGDLAPNQAAQLLAGLGALAKLIETEELERRISALEGRPR